MISGSIKYLSIAQLKLLNLGFVKEAQDAEFIMADMIHNDGEGKKSNAAKNAQNEVAKEKFEAYVEKVLSEGIA